MTKITVVRSGGILGAPRTWEVLVDEQQDPDSWRLLIQTLPWDEEQHAHPAPDRYVYRISCAPRQITLPEQEVVGPWRDLVDRVRDAAS